MPVYYPSTRVRLTIRMDNFKKRPIKAGKLVVDPQAIEIVSEGAGCKIPDIMDINSAENKDSEFVLLDSLRPLSFNVELNNFKTADTAEVHFNFADTAISSFLVRSAIIEIYLGALTPDQFINQGVIDAVRDNLLFRGFVDDWQTDFGETLRISLKCRDMTSMFLDAKINPRIATILDFNQPVHKVIRDAASTLRAAQGLCLEVRGADPNKIPNLASTIPKSIFETVKRAREVSAKKADKIGLLPPKKNWSYWDYMTFLTLSQGFVLYFDVDRLVMEPAKTVYDTDTTRISTSITRRSQFFYGFNVKEMSVRRKLQGVTVPKIVVLSYDEDSGKVLEARWPKDKNVIFTVSQQDKSSEPKITETVKTYIVSGVTDPDVLQDIAEGIYEGVGRQELEISVKTNDMSSREGIPQKDADLIRLRPGSAAEVLIDSNEYRNAVPPNIYTSFISSSIKNEQNPGSRKVTFQELNRFAVTRNEALRRSAAVSAIYRVKDAVHSWDNESGWNGTFRLINYIELESKQRSTTPP